MKCACKDNGKFACVGIGEVDEVHIIFVRHKPHMVLYSCSDVDEIGSSNGLYVLRTKRNGEKVVKILEVWL
jgi:hypothetical protein